MIKSADCSTKNCEGCSFGKCTCECHNKKGKLIKFRTKEEIIVSRILKASKSLGW